MKQNWRDREYRPTESKPKKIVHISIPALAISIALIGAGLAVAIGLIGLALRLVGVV